MAAAGIGIKEKDLDRIFEPFEQASPRTSCGAGLGLSLALKLVQAHGGTLDVQSVLGLGTRFTMKLPLYRSSLDPMPCGTLQPHSDASALPVDDGAAQKREESAAPEDAQQLLKHKVAAHTEAPPSSMIPSGMHKVCLTPPAAFLNR